MFLCITELQLIALYTEIGTIYAYTVGGAVYINDT